MSLILAAARYGAVLCAVLVLYALMWKDSTGFTDAIDHTPGLFIDFVDYYLQMGNVVFVTKAPVEGYYYSPFFAIVLGALAVLPEVVAFVVWGILQLAAVAWLFARSAARWLGDSRRMRLAYFFLLITSFPVLHNFKWGQVSTFSVLLVVGAVIAYAEERRWAAAFLLSLSFSMKFTSGIFLVYFMARRDYKFLAQTAAVATLLLAVVPALVLGPSETLAFYRSVMGASQLSLADWVPLDSNSQYFPHVIAHTMGLDPDPAAGWFTAAVYLGYAIVLLNAAAVVLAFGRKIESAEPLGMSLLFLSTPFFVPTSWPHYLVYLPLVQVLVFRMITSGERRDWRLLRLTALAGSAVVSNVFFFYYVGNHNMYGDFGFIFFANAILVVLCYVELLREVFASRSRAASVPADVAPAEAG